ncbi:MAG TPA: hypothetical protein VJ646_07125 [Candidatus Binatia bacterium]|nr:hypothetical protein [Candidatus Binatia bacterium]
MKLISVKLAREVWLFPLRDLNPQGKYLMPLLAKLIQRYRFANIPNIPDAIKANQGLLLGAGAFTDKKYGEVSVDLAIHADGVVGDTRANTEATDAFLGDVLKWVVEEEGLRPPKDMKKQYLSEVYIESERPISALNPRLNKVAKLLSSKVSGFDPTTFDVAGIIFGSTTGAYEKPLPFRIEREINVPYTQNRYYSAAQLATNDHLEVIKLLIESLKA